ncbi:hypothetical protein Pmani_024363 [Petrolisthes manimaculis]|uniref:Uncharacterized protein n=1 Tax=Petrolisthes manimaculis TaxID=1843537 RepID=A0AAE1P806_9EUCA|nr:hypothetical protein Pmani_024363 [Petrolisthes manimaculis]
MKLRDKRRLHWKLRREKEEEGKKVSAKKQCISVSPASSSGTDHTLGSVTSDFHPTTGQRSPQTPPEVVISGTTTIVSSSPTLGTDGESNDSPMIDITGDKDSPLLDITRVTSPSEPSIESIDKRSPTIQLGSVSPQLITSQEAITLSSNSSVCTISSLSQSNKVQASAEKKTKIVKSEEGSSILTSEEVATLKAAIKEYRHPFVTSEREDQLWNTILSHNPYL